MPRRKTVLALLKLGFDLKTAMDMPEIESEGILKAYMEILEPPAEKSYKVRKKRK